MEGLIYWLWLTQLNAKRAKDDASYVSQLGKVQETYGAGSSEFDHLYREAQMADTEHDRKISRLQSNYLIRQADRMLLPLPSYADKSAWQEDRPGSRTLTREARVNLRAAIRKERHEASHLPLAWAGALTGLGGVVVAIIALLVGK